MNNRLAFSCVLDYSPLMCVQTYIWLINLLAVDIKPDQIYIHLVNEVPNEFMDYLKSKGVHIIKKEPFDTRNIYCNKLVQLDTFVKKTDYDYVFLMDCDTAIVDLEGLELNNPIYAKIVDFPNPPLSILQHLFDANHLKLIEAETTFSLNEEQLTDWNNCNGGIYVVSRDFLPVLAKAWTKQALWCIDNATIFGDNYAKHADQVGFALAMASLNEMTTHLGVAWNYPTHVETDINIAPKILHFHQMVDEHMQLKTRNLEKVDTGIQIVNERIIGNLKELLNNSLFWDYRYQICPDLGSGIGSRGEILDFKKKLIRHLTFGFSDKLIADVGCGDLELMKDFDFQKYIGLDVSSEALQIAKSKRPDWEFKNDSITSSSTTNADLIFCFDVLIHQSDPKVFKSMVKAMVEKANTRLIIGAYNSKPSFSSTITHYHNGIYDEVKAFGKFDELGIVATYRDVAVLVGTKTNGIHQRDIGSELLNKAYQEVNRPDLLHYFVDVSRHYFGFYTAHYPRVFEYTWLLEQFENKSNLNILDIGAGVCPLPLCLSKGGLKVTTVDSHPTIRLQKDKAAWNEWGYLDYSTIDATIESKHCNFINYKTLKRFDSIYSISVIEHMPRAIRLKVLKRAARLLKRGGELLLTIDIEPGTNTIWNYSEGKQVEDQENHGTIDSLKGELKGCGFEILDEHIQRNIFESRTDVWYLRAILKRKAFL